MEYHKMCFWRFVRWTVVFVLLLSVSSLVTVPRGVAAQRLVQAPGLIECRVNGSLVQPVVPPGYTWSWAFVANFNHAPLSNLTRGCVAIATVGVPTVQYTYTVVTCPVEGKIGTPIGGGMVNFDGGGSIRCDLDLLAAATPGMFRVQARATFPTGSITHTLTSSEYFSFRTTSDSTCSLLTLNSAYNTMAFQHVASSLCGTQVSLGSQITKTSPTSNVYKGTHRINGAGLGDVSVTGSFGIPEHFSIWIGATGESFSLDELVIDPPGHCCSPG